MKNGYRYQSEFAKTYYGEGLVEGREQGQLHVYREILVGQLELRFGAVPDPWRRRIAAETDLDHLRDWLTRSTSIASLADLDG